MCSEYPGVPFPGGFISTAVQLDPAELHTWTNDKALRYQLDRPGVAKRYHDDLQAAGVTEALQMPTAQENTRTIIGWIAMIGVTGLFGWLAFAEGRRRAA